MQNRVEHNKKALLEALEKSLGVVTTAVKQVGIGRTTFYEYYNSDDDFKEKVDDIQNISLDYAESQLFKRMKDGSDSAIIFYLKTKGKDRGYIERHQIESKNENINMTGPELSQEQIDKLIDKL